MKQSRQGEIGNTRSLCRDGSDRPRLTAERGVALLELTVGLVACLILVFGMIDGWKMLFEAQTITTATEHGARTAGAVAHELELNRDLVHACGDTGGTSSVLTTAVSFTFKYLVATGLESGSCSPTGSPIRSCSGDSFTVSAQFATVCEDISAQQAVQVTVRANSNKRCVACFLPALTNNSMSASSVFPVEAGCDLLGGFAC